MQQIFDLAQSELLLGFETRNFARRENLIHTSAYNKFALEDIAFYCKDLVYMRKAMPLEDRVLKCLNFMNPNCRLSCSIEELQIVLTRLPNVIGTQDMDKLFTVYGTIRLLLLFHMKKKELMPSGIVCLS